MKKYEYIVTFEGREYLVYAKNNQYARLELRKMLGIHTADMVGKAVVRKMDAGKKAPAQRRSDTICWECVRSAAPRTKQCGWVRDFVQVEGWVAEAVTIHHGHGGRGDVQSYRVVECPLFVEGVGR